MIVTDAVNIAIVLVALFVLGTAETFADAASSTLIPSLVEREDLGVANARQQGAVLLLNQLVTPPIGAFLFAIGMALPFGANAAGFALGARARVAGRGEHPAASAPTARRTFAQEIAEGIRWLVHHPPMRTLALTILLFNVTYGAAWSVLVLYAGQRLGMDEVGFGLMTAAIAVGGIVGTVAYGSLERRFSLAELMRVGLLIETFTHLVLALTTSSQIALGTLVVFGAHAFVWGTTSTVVRQRAVPERADGPGRERLPDRDHGRDRDRDADRRAARPSVRDHGAVLVRVLRVRAARRRSCGASSPRSCSPATRDREPHGSADSPARRRVGTLPAMPAEFIYTTYKLARHYPPDRTVLENISISFYPGAKIGVIGPNGAGKSSLLRIMAGLDDGFTGEARLTPGFTVGYLSQEPQLDPAKDVKGNVMDGVARGPGAHRPVQRGHGQVVRPRRRLRGDRRRAGRARGQDRRGRRLEPRAQRRHRDGRPALPARRRRRHDPVRRREAPRRALPGSSSSHPDLLLLDEPTNHLDAESVDWLERFLQEYAGTVVAITHDRYFLDNVAQWILELDRGRGIPFEGNYSSWLEQKLARLAGEQKAGDARQRTLARELEWVRMAPRRGRRRARPASAPTRSCWPRPTTPRAPTRELEIAIPPGPRLGDTVIEVKDLRKGYGDRLLDRGPDVLAAEGRDRRDHRRRTAPARRRSSGCSSAQEAPDARHASRSATPSS